MPKPVRTGSIYKRTIKANTLVTALAIATTLIITWGKIVAVGSVMLAAPLFALIVGVLTFLVFPLLMAVRDKIEDKNLERAAEEEIEALSEPRRVITQTQPTQLTTVPAG